jgi:hypothetical protein
MPTEPSVSALAVEEYRALRATIRERGTIRMIVSLLTFLGWPALVALIARPLPGPEWVILPLVGLWAGFEVVLAIHIGVERIGRYVQVHYESAEQPLPAWERTAMRLGREPAAATGSDPLLLRLFVLAALLNLLPLAPYALAQPSPSTVTIQLAVTVVVHLAFLIRLAQARRFTRGQRARDLDLFSRPPAGR